MMRAIIMPIYKKMINHFYFKPEADFFLYMTHRDSNGI